MGEASRVLRQIASEESLWTAWDEVRAARGAPGVDGRTVASFDAAAGSRIEELSRRILNRRYRPRPLRRIWVPKSLKAEEYRPISIPSVRDRVASGAAHHVLEHLFEPEFHDSSHGFRTGRGTLTALRHVRRLHERGRVWAAQADVDEFFDRIDQSLLFRRLEDLLPWDVRRLLILWTRCWVWDGVERYRMTRGVPQGTPTSPLLANHYLTPLDEALAFERFSAVRYVDDLIVVTRSEDRARTALETAEAALRRLGLRLNTTSRSVRSFDEGLEYLGFELRGRVIRVAPSKIQEFRRHAAYLLEDPRAGSMRQRIAKLNEMIRGWRAYYRVGIPREQFERLDRWLEREVKEGVLKRWSRQRVRREDLVLSGLESLAVSGRRVFQPQRPPSLEGYEYRIPVGAETEDASGDTVLRTGSRLGWEGGRAVLRRNEVVQRLPDAPHTLVIEDGVECQSHALRRLLDAGVALRFVRSVREREG